VQNHLAAYAACQQFMRDMQHLGEHLRRLTLRPHAPAAIRERVFTPLSAAHALVDDRGSAPPGC
jgi:hypothetical protein